MGKKWLWRGMYQKIFLVMFAVGIMTAGNRDFVQSNRYSSFQQWVADIIPATFGLILAAAFNAAIIYGIYRLYLLISKKKEQPEERVTNVSSKKNRPIGMTIVGVFIIITSAATALSATGAYSNVQALQGRLGGSEQLARFFIFSTGIISLTCGIFLLRGAAWARVVYLTLSAILWACSIAMLGLRSSLLGLICYLVVFIYLTRPTADNFLRHTTEK